MRDNRIFSHSTLWDHIEMDISCATERGVVDYITGSGIDCWIYGHSHRNIDKTIDATQCLCNQFGYVSHNEHIISIEGRSLKCDRKMYCGNTVYYN